MACGADTGREESNDAGTGKVALTVGRTRSSRVLCIASQARRDGSPRDSGCQPRILRCICRNIATRGKCRVTFDAQCDLAAVVYRSDDDPDRLFIEFADDLRRSGRRPVGLIQIGRSCRSQDPGLGVLMLPGADVVPLVGDLPSCTAGCRLDVRRLAGAAERVAGAIAGGGRPPHHQPLWPHGSRGWRPCRSHHPRR